MPVARTLPRPRAGAALGLSTVLIAVLAAFLAAPSFAAAGAAPNELIVKFDAGTSRAESRAIVADTDSSIEQRLPGRTAVVDVPADQSVTQVATALGTQDGVLYAEPNFTVTRSSTSNDSFLNDGTLWGLLKTKVPLTWGVTRGAGITVAVLDSGIALSNPDLVNNVWQNTAEIDNGADDDGNGFVDDLYGADWVHRDGTPDDEEGHGTHVAGTIAAAADDGNPSVGVAPSARVMPLKFLDGRGAGSVSDALAAIDYAVTHGASVINASWGGPDFSRALQDSVDRAGQAGVVFVTAAGNDGSDNDSAPIYPASFDLPNVISVAATTRQNELADFSNYGQSVDIAAPGVDIYSTVGDSYESWSGTSMAAPHVAGVAALLKSTEPTAAAATIVQAIEAGARPVADLIGKVKTNGVLDAARSFRMIGHEVGDTVGPRSFRLKKPGKKVTVGRGGKVKFSWSRAFDEDLSGYEIYVNGRLKATIDDPDGAGAAIAKTSAKIRVGAGKLRWSVVAVDEAGNERKAKSGKSRGRVAVSRKR
ncbi:MAG: S8 family peptidase [Solirubrobacterales bacterium]